MSTSERFVKKTIPIVQDTVSLAQEILDNQSDILALINCVPITHSYNFGRDFIDTLIDTLNTKGKIHAIKWLRYAFAPNMMFGLKEAKDIVDEIEVRLKEGSMRYSETGYCNIEVKR